LHKKDAATLPVQYASRVWEESMIAIGLTRLDVIWHIIAN
jgi:hypothetical protein